MYVYIYIYIYICSFLFYLFIFGRCRPARRAGPPPHPLAAGADFVSGTGTTTTPAWYRLYIWRVSVWMDGIYFVCVQILYRILCNL